MNIDCDVSEQFPRRVMRGTLLKAVLAMSQQLQIMKGNQHSDIPAFGAKARGKLVELTLTLESEIYMLLDYIEITFLTMNFLESNLSLLREFGFSSLVEQITPRITNVKISDELSVTISGSQLYANVLDENYHALDSQFPNPQKVRLARFYHDNNFVGPAEVARRILDTRDLSIYSHLPFNSKSLSDSVASNAKDYLVLGSLVIPALLRVLTQQISFNLFHLSQ